MSAKLICEICGRGNARSTHNNRRIHLHCDPQLVKQARREKDRAAYLRRGAPQKTRDTYLATLVRTGLPYRTTLAQGAPWPYTTT